MLVDFFNWIGDCLEVELVKGLDLDIVILMVLKEIMENYGQVIFGGNGYFEEWYKMVVEEWGLVNLCIIVDVLLVLKEKYIEDLFEKIGVLILVELESCFEVYVEQYIFFIEVEVKLVVSMVKMVIYLVVVEYLFKFFFIIVSFSGLGIDFEKESVKKIVDLIN